MKRALLISMPFATTLRPSIGLGLLKAALIRDGLPCDIRYLNLSFAAQIGGDLYEQIAGGIPQLLLGESIFTAEVFGEGAPSPERFIDEFVSRFRRESLDVEDGGESLTEDCGKLIELRYPKKRNSNVSTARSSPGLGLTRHSKRD